MWWPVRAALQALLAGQPVPAHVAFIMDGNRRFADAAGVEPLEGHTLGYGKMVDAIRWCFELGVAHVSVYAFSLDNFKRGADEVAGLMALAADKFEALLEVRGFWYWRFNVAFGLLPACGLCMVEGRAARLRLLRADAKLQRCPVRVALNHHLLSLLLYTKDESARRWGAELRVLGDLSRAPPAVAAAAARLMRASAELAAAAPPGAPRRVVNVCFAYSSGEELGAALARLRGAVAGGQLLPSDVTPALLRAALHTGRSSSGVADGSGSGSGAGGIAGGGGAGGSPPVDLVMRTSGEERLSDFLLWQSGGALLEWLPALWPRLSFLDLLRAVRRWQAARPALAALRAAVDGAEQRLVAAGGSGSGGGGGDGGSGGGSVFAPTAGAGVERHATNALAAAACSCGCGHCSSSSSSGGGGGGSGGGADLIASTAAAAAAGAAGAPPAAPGGQAPGRMALERAQSPPGGRRAALAAIREDAPACAPHPCRAARVGAFLAGLDAARREWIRATLERQQAAAAAAAAEAAGGCGGQAPGTVAERWRQWQQQQQHH